MDRATAFEILGSFEYNDDGTISSYPEYEDWRMAFAINMNCVVESLANITRLTEELEELKATINV